MVQLYQERLYWHIRQLVKQHADADEVLQTTFIKAYKGIHNFRGEAQLYTWLHRIATNESLSFLKKQQRRATLNIDEPESSTARSLEAEAYLDMDRAQQLLAAALESLPEKQRQVFMLRYYDELSYKEIEQLLETSVGALKASYHHAAKKIEAYIKATI